MKKIGMNILIYVLIAACIISIIWGFINRREAGIKTYDDNVTHIDLDSIYLKDSGVQVDFSEVILSKPQETRKLIVSEQEDTASTILTDRIVQKLDFDFLKKTQQVHYTGKGYFVVDLDHLTKDRIIDDPEAKTVTILIDHAYLEALEINPNNIIIDEVQEGLLARGDIELSVRDYRDIESELRAKMVEKLDTSENGQEADAIALRMVKEVYEPIIKAIDNDYSVIVEFA